MIIYGGYVLIDIPQQGGNTNSTTVTWLSTIHML